MLLPLLTMLVGLLGPVQAPAKLADDEAGARAAINHYLQGHATGDASHMRIAFLPTAHIEGLRDGKFVSMTLDEYCSRFPGKPAEDEATRKRTIDQIDLSGTAGMAKATLTHGQTKFTDYFVLAKVDGTWKIANKVFYTGRAQ